MPAYNRFFDATLVIACCGLSPACHTPQDPADDKADVHPQVVARHSPSLKEPRCRRRVIFCATNRRMVRTSDCRPRFGVEHGSLRFGKYRLSIGANRERGSIEEIRIRWASTADKLDDLEAVAAGKQWADVLIFIHGFFVAHEESIRRAAQIATELRFEGAVIVFSWPSLCRFGKDAYRADCKSIQASVGAFRDFLNQLRRKMPESKLHVLAHSLGCRLITQTCLESRSLAMKLQNVLFAAPDIDCQRFNSKLAEPLQRDAHRVSVLYSDCDPLLRIAEKLNNGRPRLGCVGFDRKQHQLIEGVDYTALGCSLATHNYYREHPVLLKDIRCVLSGRMPRCHRVMIRGISISKGKRKHR